MANTKKYAKQFFKGLFKALWMLLGIILKLILAAFYLVSKLLEIGLVHINKAAELVLMGREHK